MFFLHCIFRSFLFLFFFLEKNIMTMYFSLLIIMILVFAQQDFFSEKCRDISNDGDGIVGLFYS